MLKELNHNSLKYSGPAGEQVTVKVQALGTTFLVNYTLDGVTLTLAEGDDITFTLAKKANDEPTVLELVIDYNSAGSYVVTVVNVSSCVKDTGHKNTCVHTWPGPPLAIKDFSFFAD
jgi:hypothetical protein